MKKLAGFDMLHRQEDKELFHFLFYIAETSLTWVFGHPVAYLVL